MDLKTKTHQVLANQYQNKPFNSPNKVIQSSQGCIYFSDPDYGYNQGFKPKPQLPQSIYAFHPNKEGIHLISRDFSLPHGLGLSGNHHQLYISDTAATDEKSPYNPKKTKGILVATLIKPTKISQPKFLLQVPTGIPDGFVVTPNNELWVAAGDGVRHYSSAGKLLDKIPIPQGAINLTMGHQVLYVTADTAIYHIALK
ncbi:SMP-30/gluconolactonase/LRE family protein [Shewanella surugensis]|uniref:SMP-30/gluconolactonase/LRE family protein n=1 Tax=Shewanella surugensis TaxID=212020 RepID=A0ABT0LI28_9GAMM|nr:SMP-30/gluconolactonase/LRE family protein [Shewanella surugensis]MCL1127015.1 SMP-30/gluconolactonase/LRE family protein [Shewanella surugensis]